MAYKPGSSSAAWNSDYNKKRAAKLRRDKKSYEEIAQILGVDKSRVGVYLSEVREEWRKERLDDIEDVLQQELQSLDQMEQDVAAIFDKINPSDEEIDLFAASDAAVKLLQARLKIMEQRQKLLGLNKPVKVDVKNETKIITAEQSKEIRSDILDRLTPKSKE
jgi:predicted transcriptional regulator